MTGLPVATNFHFMNYFIFSLHFRDFFLSCMTAHTLLFTSMPFAIMSYLILTGKLSIMPDLFPCSFKLEISSFKGKSCAKFLLLSSCKIVR